MRTRIRHGLMWLSDALRWLAGYGRRPVVSLTIESTMDGAIQILCQGDADQLSRLREAVAQEVLPMVGLQVVGRYALPQGGKEVTEQ